MKAKFYKDFNLFLNEFFKEESNKYEKKSVYGGCISNAYEVTLPSGRKFFLKQSNHKQLFEKEGLNLSYLRKYAKTPIYIPEVYGYSDSFLALEFIEHEKPKREFFKDFGEGLANLHLASPSIECGFETDNFIGETPQINKMNKSWCDFFAKNRLHFQLNLAIKQGFGEKKLVKRVSYIIDHIKNLIPDVKPCLLHGDLWGGNYITTKNGLVCLIDPACYFGHFEADLAFTECFGGFLSEFYYSYSAINKIEKEYNKRKKIYNLYHMLNHLNLFGKSYLSSIYSLTEEFCN